ncbi:MAG: precorrin-8X methylmutase [Hyphomonadaceae bacterium]|nr:precorrin-8X methylmutase [Clostridia bacterium]
MKPHDIEMRSFEMISELLGDRVLDEQQAPIIKRVIHTTADFDYVNNLKFSAGAVDKAITALKAGTSIFTDTNMAASGINKPTLHKFGGQVYCFMADADVAQAAKEKQSTRAVACVDKAVDNPCIGVYIIGNAPTALMRLCELIDQGRVSPALVVGVPVGFVNVVECKEMLMQRAVPYIVAQGRKGGSNVAAAIANALLYIAIGDERQC